MSLSAAFKISITQSLTQLVAILEKGAAHAAARAIPEEVFLSARLYPDMLPFTRQIHIASDVAARGAARLTGQTPASVPDDEKSFAELIARVKMALQTALAAPDAEIDAAATRMLTLPLGPMTVTMSGADYVFKFVLPNVHFHATIAYALLRHNGVELGKADFLGGL